jgi:hypothetical protein
MGFATLEHLLRSEGWRLSHIATDMRDPMDQLSIKMKCLQFHPILSYFRFQHVKHSQIIPSVYGRRKREGYYTYSLREREAIYTCYTSLKELV